MNGTREGSGPMHREALTKPDGRGLWLYSREPMHGPFDAPAPPGPPVVANSELRWHPLRGEWVAYASHRQERTFLPPPDWDPLAPMKPGGHPTELPGGDWQVAVFENRFPALSPRAPEPPHEIVGTRAGRGACEVVVYTPSANGSIADLEAVHLELLIDVWADRCEELGARKEIEYVMPFENRGAEVGATLHHPHGQIYAYPVVPPIPARELELMKRHWVHHGEGLLARHLKEELEEDRRILFAGEHVVAFVPVFARYPYEVWIAPRRAAPRLAALDRAQRADLGRALCEVVHRYDGVRPGPFPYVMVIHQAPSDGEPHPEAHVHFEFYPPYRTAERLKYLAGTEIGAGFFTNDALPEAKAEELKAVTVGRDDGRRPSLAGRKRPR